MAALRSTVGTENPANAEIPVSAVGTALQFRFSKGFGSTGMAYGHVAEKSRHHRPATQCVNRSRDHRRHRPGKSHAYMPRLVTRHSSQASQTAIAPKSLIVGETGRVAPTRPRAVGAARRSDKTDHGDNPLSRYFRATRSRMFRAMASIVSVWEKAVAYRPSGSIR